MNYIKLENVSYSYNSGTEEEIVAIQNINMSVNIGEIVALVGHNGSGKSTIAKLLNGLILPNSGSVTVGEYDTNNKNDLFDIRKNVGVVFQNPDNQMIATIIEDDVAFGPENIGLPPKEISDRVDWALKCVGMSEHRLGTPFRLSGGQKQRVAIAGVLAIKPRVIVLDESTAMLDPQGRREVMEVVKKLNREEGMAVVLITHFMEEALLADRIIVLDKGAIVMEGGREIFREETKLREIGLDIPVAARIANRLRENGVELGADIVDEDGLVAALELLGGSAILEGQVK